MQLIVCSALTVFQHLQTAAHFWREGGTFFTSCEGIYSQKFFIFNRFLGQFPGMMVSGDTVPSVVSTKPSNCVCGNRTDICDEPLWWFLTKRRRFAEHFPSTMFSNTNQESLCQNTTAYQQIWGQQKHTETLPAVFHLMWRYNNICIHKSIKKLQRFWRIMT